jgi:hypothetical protein
VENDLVLIDAFTHMICEHLRPLEQAILARGIRETFRGQAWSLNCREWVYFDCFIDTASVRANLVLYDCVHEHLHRGTHDGQERGFVCSQCHDGVMGSYEQNAGTVVFKG